MSHSQEDLRGIQSARLDAFKQREAERYADARPQTLARLQSEKGSFLDDVPMHWMKDWPMPFPMLVSHAKGARLVDLDDNAIDDFCLGDTGSMFGHSPDPVARAIAAQADQGLTYMLPTEHAFEAGRLLTEKFGDFRWQIATTASDANRFALSVARAVTGKPKVLVFEGCYHGAVPDVMVTLENGETKPRPGLTGQVVDLTELAICAEFNDLDSVEAALKSGEVAAIITEPVLTNSCMVLPAPGFHDGLRKLATEYGALLIMDETHTISSGLGGYTGVSGLDPDIFVVGKCVAGGMPTAVWGMRQSLADAYTTYDANRPGGHSGLGTTLSANPMQFACLRANLSEVMTAEAYAHMEAGAERLAQGLQDVITRVGADWHVVRVGARVEFICAPGPLTSGTQARTAHAPEIEAAMHVGLLNRGCLIAPFHNMMLVSPVTENAQIDRLVAAFDDIMTELFEG
ncbi:aspartate aminotransferase family protein [Ruegeria halocynthiae]|uniref:aspartate aminotransferase family protein n=1 Tax=Ruegeria halocynthiae TaxID=985054 RepID=UPI00068D5D2B|nr:aspartate aminotransferase family protein [Ruegeria halocynthiae]